MWGDGHGRLGLMLIGSCRLTLRLQQHNPTQETVAAIPERGEGGKSGKMGLSGCLVSAWGQTVTGVGRHTQHEDRKQCAREREREPRLLCTAQTTSAVYTRCGVPLAHKEPGRDRNVKLGLLRVIIAGSKLPTHRCASTAPHGTAQHSTSAQDADQAQCPSVHPV